LAYIELFKGKKAGFAFRLLIGENRHFRESPGRWPEGGVRGLGGSIAVGSKSFIESIKASLGLRAKGRDVLESGKGYQLRESPALYNVLFDAENEGIELENAYFWQVKDE